MDNLEPEVLAYRPEILEFFNTPLTWAIAEVLAFALFFYCVINILKSKENKGLKTFHILELFGFIVYAGIFENLGVLSNTYSYSFARFTMVGAVPLSLLMFEAAIFYASFRFAEVLKFPRWVVPIVVAMLGMWQDLTIDPVACFDLHLVDSPLTDGVKEYVGRWNWTEHYENTFFGIPYFNYTGWYLLMFYYSALLSIGRAIYDKFDKKFFVGIIYTVLSPILGVALILSPLTKFLLFLEPMIKKDTSMIAEISTWSTVSIISAIILIVFMILHKSNVVIRFKKDRLIWVVPVVLHLFNLILALSVGELRDRNTYIPVLIFGSIHLLFIGYFFLRSYIYLWKNKEIKQKS